MDDGTWLDATAQAELVRRREVKPEELVEAARARFDQLEPALNAGNRGRIATRQPCPVGDLAEKVRSHHRRGVSISEGHPNTLDCAASVHLAGALLVRLLDASATSESLTTRASPRMGPGQVRSAR